MKFTVSSNGGFHINCGAKNNTTTGNNLFDIFTKIKKSNKSTKDEIPQLDHQLFDGTIDGNLRSVVELEIDSDELKELAEYCKKDFDLQKESAKFIYQGIKKFLDDLINGIKNRGKEIVDVIGDVNKNYLEKKAEIDKFEKELKEENKDK